MSDNLSENLDIKTSNTVNMNILDNNKFSIMTPPIFDLKMSSKIQQMNGLISKDGIIIY